VDSKAGVQIGFKRVTAIHRCFIGFNYKTYKIGMDLPNLCPFKVLADSMRNSPQTAHIITLRPTYLLRQDNRKKVRELGKRELRNESPRHHERYRTRFMK